MEYFSKHLWQNLRPFNSLNMDEVGAIAGALHATDRTDATSMAGFSKVLADALFWKAQTAADLFRTYPPQGQTPFENTPYYNMYRFVNWYLIAWKTTTGDLHPLVLDGLNVTSDFDEPADTLTIFIKGPSYMFTLMVNNLRNNATRDIALRTQITAGGFILDVTYKPLTSRLPQVNMASLDGYEILPVYDLEELIPASGLDPADSVQETYAVNLPGLLLDDQGQPMDSRFILPSGSLAVEDLQGLVEDHLGNAGADDVEVLLTRITDLAEADLDTTTGAYYTLGFENTNNRYGFRVLLNLSGVPDAQARDMRTDLLEWAAESGPRVFYMLGSGIGSLEAYRSLMHQQLGDFVMEHVIFVLSKPYTEDRLFSLDFQPGWTEFQVVPEAFYRQDLSGGPALLYGIGVEEERYASEETNVQRGQFIKGDARLFSAATAYVKG
jgi:hypothetical protein